MTGHNEPEFCYRIVVDELPTKGRSFDVSADDDARAALSNRFGFSSFECFEGRISAVPLAGGPIIRVSGKMSATLSQTCVATLEPVPTKIVIEIEADFGPPVELEDELEFTLEDVEPHDVIADGAIDLGELAAQQLALSLDPYPRAPGAEVSQPRSEEEVPGSQEADNPFAALAKLKGRMESGN